MDFTGKVRDQHRRGHAEPEIVTALFGGEDPRAARTNDQFSCENLIRAVLQIDKSGPARQEKGG